MAFSSILFNPSARVYTLRFLLLAALCTPALFAVYEIYTNIIVSVACSLLIAGRHILVQVPLYHNFWTR
jgi:hypothetical protein